MANFYYEINKQITNIFDGYPLQIVGYTSIYLDENKTILLTEIPFSQMNMVIMFDECPTDSKEAFLSYVDNKVLEAVNSEEIQNKLNQVKLAYDLQLVD